jgi:hypothetical protein
MSGDDIDQEGRPEADQRNQDAGLDGPRSQPQAAASRRAT